MRVRDIMTHRILTVSPNTPLDAAARKMAKAKVSTLIVVEGGSPIGLVTSSDIIKRVVAKNRLPSSVVVGEIMSTPLITVGADDPLEKALDLMGKYRVRRLPVVDRGKLVGILTVTDIARAYPDLLRLYAPKLLPQSEGEPVSGICERCGNYSDDLRLVDGLFLCEECRREVAVSKSSSSMG